MSTCAIVILSAITSALFSFLIFKAFSQKFPPHVSLEDYNGWRVKTQNRIHSLERRGLKPLAPKDVRKGMRVWVFEGDYSPWPTTVTDVTDFAFYYDCGQPTGCIHSRDFKNVALWVDENTKTRKG